MNTQQRAAMQMALRNYERILETVPAQDGNGGLVIDHHDMDGEYVGSEQVDPMLVIQQIVGIAHNTIAALREALAEQEDEIYWIETNKALAKEIIELKRQAEQEPVGYFAYDEEHDIWEELTGPNAPGATKLYAAPVRTKDLTDDEIERIGKSYFDEWSFGFARAVIAADREKNK